MCVIVIFAFSHSRCQSIRSHLNISSARDQPRHTLSNRNEKNAIFFRVCGHGLQFCRRKRPLPINMQSKDTKSPSNSFGSNLFDSKCAEKNITGFLADVNKQNNKVCIHQIFSKMSKCKPYKNPFYVE